MARASEAEGGASGGFGLEAQLFEELAAACVLCIQSLSQVAGFESAGSAEGF